MFAVGKFRHAGQFYVNDPLVFFKKIAKMKFVMSFGEKSAFRTGWNRSKVRLVPHGACIYCCADL